MKIKVLVEIDVKESMLPRVLRYQDQGVSLPPFESSLLLQLVNKPDASCHQVEIGTNKADLIHLRKAQ